MTKIQLKDAAVSPVIGVMLMLVVTIIIAAVVSAFAGSLAGGTDKAPQMAISGKLLNGDKLVLTHRGGDPLVWETIEIRTVILSGDFRDMSYVVDLTKGTYDPDGSPLLTTSGGYSTWGKALNNGETATIKWAGLFKLPAYVPSKGGPVDIQIFDKITGKMILSTKVTNK